MTLNGIKNRCTKWQCVSIPSNCPHAIDNDLEEEVVILWNYLSLTDKVTINRGVGGDDTVAVEEIFSILSLFVLYFAILLEVVDEVLLKPSTSTFILSEENLFL